MTRFIMLLAAVLAFVSPPLAMAKGAAAMPHGAAASADGGHCPGTGTHEDAPDRGSQIDCSTACSVAPAFPPTLMERVEVSPTLPALARQHDLAGIHPEGEKPPPRTSPEI